MLCTRTGGPLPRLIEIVEPEDRRSRPIAQRVDVTAERSSTILRGPGPHVPRHESTTMLVGQPMYQRINVGRVADEWPWPDVFGAVAVEAFIDTADSGRELRTS